MPGSTKLAPSKHANDFVPDFPRYHRGMTKNAPTLTKKAEVAQRRHELSQLVSRGIRRHRDLAERLGVSERTVQRDLAELERAYTERGADQMVEIQNRERMISWQRIEDAIRDLQPMIENERTRIQALRLLKELEERRSKLLGLDMPTKHAATDPTGQTEYGGIPTALKRELLLAARRKREAEEAPTIMHEPMR
jgi:DNA-binding transcriptional regulator YhcF (GntR family)